MISDPKGAQRAMQSGSGGGGGGGSKGVTCMSPPVHNLLLQFSPWAAQKSKFPKLIFLIL